MNDLYARMESDLRLARRSDGTRTQYLRHLRQFLDFTPTHPEEELSQADVRAWLHHLQDDRKVGTATQKMATDAVKFLFRQTLGRPEEVAQIPMPKVPTSLPVVLGNEELSPRPLAFSSRLAFRFSTPSTPPRTSSTRPARLADEVRSGAGRGSGSGV